MPFGIKKSVGGDNAANDAKMERCVANLQAKGHDKVSAIRICKVSIQRAAAKK
jgi:hypothetical protein